MAKIVSLHTNKGVKFIHISTHTVCLELYRAYRRIMYPAPAG